MHKFSIQRILILKTSLQHYAPKLLLVLAPRAPETEVKDPDDRECNPFEVRLFLSWILSSRFFFCFSEVGRSNPEGSDEFGVESHEREPDDS
jgi:hypothetical protein